MLHGGPFPPSFGTATPPETESVYFDLDNTPWVKCDKCHTPFHLQCGTWESLYVVRSRRFLCTFFVAGNFRSDFSLPSLPVSLDLFVFLKMGRRPLCPDGEKKKKRNQVKRIKTRKRTGPPELRPSETPVWVEGLHTRIDLLEIHGGHDDAVH